jgi:hypothetical protein
LPDRPFLKTPSPFLLFLLFLLFLQEIISDDPFFSAEILGFRDLGEKKTAGAGCQSRSFEITACLCLHARGATDKRGEMI